MHYTVKVYIADGSILYIVNTIDLGLACSHYHGATKMNKAVTKTEFYIDGELIGTRE